MFRRLLHSVAPGIALWLAPAVAGAQGTELQRAQMAIAGLDITSADIVAYCESGGPAAVAPLRTAWQSWRTRAAVDDITRQMDATLLQKTRDGMVKVTASARQRLAGAGQPATVCPQLASMWSSADFDVRTKFAIAYAPAPAVGTTTATAGGGDASIPATAPTTGRSINPRSYYEISRPTGTVYSVAQLDALDDQWRGKPYNHDRAMDAMKAAGIIFIRGLVIKRGSSFFVVTRDSTFDSKLVVSPSVDVEAFEGQQITVAGRLEELPMSVVFLRSGGVVRDPSALVPSTLPTESGMRRRGVTVEQVTAAAGRGLKTTEILGVLYNGEGRIGYSGNYEFHEETMLFLKDGWAYDRDDVPPTDLDVALSRRIEPQSWSRWRSTPTGYELQEQDDRGRLSGTWSRAKGRLINGWGTTHTIAGYYSSQAFYGSAALGGTFVRNSWLFRADGRWERSGYTQSGSGTMAAQQPVGFSSSAVGVSDGRGTRSVASGGTADVHASSQSSKDDGARNRGTYRLDGMVLEMRSDAGEVWRSFCVPINDKTIYMNGTSYSMK